jgi:hypothetical protein
MKHVFFVHIHKTGGISVEAMIRGRDGPVSPAFVSHFISETDWATVGDYKYFFAHSPLCIREILPRPLFVFTFLRDPIDRVISHYNHFLRLKGELVYETIVKERLDLPAALEHPALSPHLSNNATRQLGVDFDLRGAWPNAEAMNLAAFWAQAAPIDESVYARAEARLAELDFVGFTERFERDCQELARRLGFIAGAIPFENATPADYCWPLPKATRTLEIEKAIRQHNAFDCSLYETARKLYGETKALERATARHAIAKKATGMIAKYVELADVKADRGEQWTPFEAWAARVRRLEADLAEKFQWADNYRRLAESLEQRLRQTEDERDQKFEWAVNYRQSAEALQQAVENLQRKLDEVEADRDEKFMWAENYKTWMENEKKRADDLGLALERLKMSKPTRIAQAATRILRRLTFR